MTAEECGDWSRLPKNSRAYRQDNIVSQRPPGDFPVEFGKKTYRPLTGYWKTGIEGMKKIIDANRVEERGRMLSYVRFFDDFPMRPVANFWNDVRFSSRSESKQYVVQTAARVAERCLLMTTDPGDLVFDPTCGSGTTAVVAESWGRRWITCDTSRVAVTLAKQRLMTASFDYFQLRHPHEGVSSGFIYKTVPHVMLKSIANNPDIKPGMLREEIDAAIKRHAESETLYDQPLIDNKKARVTGPFTVEAVPAPTVRPVGDVTEEGSSANLAATEARRDADITVARSGGTLRHSEWRDELLKAGVRAKGGSKIEFTRVEPLSGLRWLHAEAETKDKRQRVVVSFGPEHAPLEQKQVEWAREEALKLRPKPDMLLFASFQFDPEAAKDIDELTPELAGMTLLKVQMNTDLLTDDLKKKRASNESFWLMGQPDVEVKKIKTGEHKGKVTVEVHGFDYYDPRQGKIISGDTKQIAVWFLDTDYDGRSLFPRQVFFPMAGENDGWARLAKNLKAEIDEEKIEAYRGTVSLPFVPGDHKRVAVKIVDDRGIESLKILEV